MGASLHVPLSHLVSSSESGGCSSDCLAYQPRSTLTPIDVAAKLASTEGISSSEASNLRREIDVALKDLKGFDAQITRLKLSILALQNERAAFEEMITDSKGLLSPVRKLPIETMTQVFSHCCVPNRVTVQKNTVTIDAPATTLMQVCRSWHSTVTSTKALWATIRLDVASEMNDRDSEKVQVAISRIVYASGKIPLDVTIRTVSIQGGLHSSVHSLISEAKRWKVASLIFLNPQGDQLWQALMDNLPVLERVKMSFVRRTGHPHNYQMFAHAPRLRTISLRYVESGSIVSLPHSQIKIVRLRYVSLRDILDILHETPLLDHLTLTNPQWESNEMLADKTIHSFPAKYFQIKWKNWHTSNRVKNLLARLSFPSLEEIHLDDREFDEPIEDKFQVGTQLLSHLSPSSKTLHTLTLERLTMHSDDLVNLLIMLPQVKTLRLLKTSANQGVTPEVIRRLHGYGNGGAQRVLLPKLADLEIDISRGVTFASLLDMVRSRLVLDTGRAHCRFVSLKNVNLWIHEECFNQALRADMLELAMGGIVVCIRDSKGLVDYS